MTSVTQSIKPWGNSLGLRLPAAIAKAVGLHADQCVKISTKGQTVIITPCEQKPLSVEERLARFDPIRHGGEVMSTEGPLGAERWRERPRVERQTEEMSSGSTVSRKQDEK